MFGFFLNQWSTFLLSGMCFWPEAYLAARIPPWLQSLARTCIGSAAQSKISIVSEVGVLGVAEATRGGTWGTHVSFYPLP